MGETAFQMEPALICSEYRQAKNKTKQIDILADLNMCSPRTIAQLLRDLGEELPAVWIKRLERPAKDSPEHRAHMAEVARQQNRKNKAEAQDGTQETRGAEGVGPYKRRDKKRAAGPPPYGDPAPVRRPLSHGAAAGFWQLPPRVQLPGTPDSFFFSGCAVENGGAFWESTQLQT